ncbi:conserved hypothetical protein [Theileria orientalis strain Shintoku]|uniref:Uncharacterized protein n=1 Tax=Theileria orientalis strain Shintoku TaxID=869250 RepID=J4C318_THEOR|nr:conserved hypothetical protein [Theileria orientalis strain Shintoku]BAM39666.1 conserved hypothetical protein [Theileria orientalis strain Shintoku]|eukprot:XP_009689967.1 conserved hypothetical protein [Theileria orientalis strain Shintoku]
MNYSERELAVVDNGPNGQLGCELASGCDAQDDIFATVLENVSFVVRTFESSESNSLETKCEPELSGFHLLDQFEDSYFSLVNDKISRLEGKEIGRPLGEKNRTSEKDSKKMVSILGDVWIAEFDVPADLELFKKILTNAIRTVCPNLKPFDGNNTQPSALEDPKDGKNSRKSIDSFEKVISRTKNYSKRENIDLDHAKASEEPASIDRRDDVINPPATPVKNKTTDSGGCKKSKSKLRKRLPRSVKSIRFYEVAEPVSKDKEEEESVEKPVVEQTRQVQQEEKEPLQQLQKVQQEKEQLDQEDNEYEEYDLEEDFEDCDEFELFKRTSMSPEKPKPPVDKCTDYLKTEEFAQMLANCPFFSGPKVNNAAIASRKAAFIIDKLTKESQTLRSKSSGDEAEVSDSGFLSTEAILRATESYELMELTGRLSFIGDTVKRRTKKRYRRIFTSTPRYLRRPKYKSRHSFLQVRFPHGISVQKLDALVDRITTKYINRKKNEIVCENFYRTMTDPTEYVAGTHGWNHDPYLSNRQGPQIHVFSVYF